MEKGNYQCRNFGKNCEYARNRSKLACEDGLRLTVDGKEFKCPVAHPTCQHELRKTGGSNGHGGGKKWLLIGGVAALVALALWLGWPSSRPQPVAIIVALTGPGGFERELQLSSSTAVERVAVKDAQNGSESAYPNKDKSATRLRIRHSLSKAPEVVYTRINSGEWAEHRFDNPRQNPPAPPSPPLTQSNLRTVQLRVKADNVTNALLTLESSEPVLKVSVKLYSLNHDEVHEFSNTDVEASKLSFEVPPYLRWLREASVRVNEQPPKKFEFGQPGDALVNAAKQRVKEAVIAAERIAFSTQMLRYQSTNQPPDPQAIRLANDAMDYWTREYPAQIKALERDFPADVSNLGAKALRDQYCAEGPGKCELVQVVLPILADHLRQMKMKAEIAPGFQAKLANAILGMTNSLKIPQQTQPKSPK